MSAVKEKNIHYIFKFKNKMMLIKKALASK